MECWDLKQALLHEDCPQQQLQELVFCFRPGAHGLVRDLASLTALTSITASFNGLQSLSGIEALQRLRHLDVSHNALTCLRPLAALTTLTCLVVACNRVASTAPLARLTSLSCLALHDNRISTADDVCALSALQQQLRHLTLCSNPVCQQEHWRQATIALLPNLQALDSERLSIEHHAAATAHRSLWADAAGTHYGSSPSTGGSSTSGTPGGAAEDSSCAAGQQTHMDIEPRAASGSRLSSPGRCGSRGSSRLGSGLQARASAAAVADDASIKDVHALLPRIALQPSKPSSLVRRPQDTRLASRFNYSRSRPLTTLLQQKYAGSNATAVLVRSDGSAGVNWPEGGLAVSLDVEDAPAAAASASSGCGGGSSKSSGSGCGAPSGAGGRAGTTSSSSSSCSTLPIRGYRLLAMHRAGTSVAASFDSSGGFAQWQDGALMLVAHKAGGTLYGRDGRVAQTYAAKKRPLQEDVEVRLDAHLTLRLLARTHKLQLTFACDGCEVALSQRHGTILPDREVASAPHPPLPQPGVLAPDAAAGAAASGAADSPAPAAGDSDGLQSLMARARALMASSHAGAGDDAGEGSFDAAD